MKINEILQKKQQDLTNHNKNYDSPECLPSLGDGKFAGMQIIALNAIFKKCQLQ